MNDGAVDYLGRSEGFEIGAGPSVVMMDDGMAKQTSTTMRSQDVRAFIFSQSGLVAGLGLQGNEITKLDKRLSRGVRAALTTRSDTGTGTEHWRGGRTPKLR